MRTNYCKLLIILILGLAHVQVNSQSLPIGTPVLEEYYRRQQLLGRLDSSISFSIRPLFPSESFKVSTIFNPDNIDQLTYPTVDKSVIRFFGDKGILQILPLSIQQQYNSHHPYGWNDGALIPARGYQSMISGGIFAKIGILSIQLRPEFVYAQNKSFDGYALDRSDDELRRYFEFHYFIDEPEQFGNGHYSKINWGQSSIRLTVGPASLGISNENLWWGPGRKNSITLTNNSSGFKHITLNTVRPIGTPIGSFEGQIIAGKLENSNLPQLNQNVALNGQNLEISYNKDWRYLAGVNINYQPKWVPGLFLGFIRDFMSYGNDLNTFKDYFPFFFPVQKSTIGSQGDPYVRDQRIALYTRWLFPKAHAEIYFEYGLNDNSYNYRDFLGNPEHARAYVFGISKMIPLTSRKNEFIQINTEINQLAQTVDRLVRPSGGFYQHSGVRQGYTHLGEVIGAGSGTGGNVQSMEISWNKGLKAIGLSFERFEHNADFYNDYIMDLNGQSRRWVDFSLAAQGTWIYKNFVFSAKVQGIQSLNYQWRMNDYEANTYYVPHNDIFNLHVQTGISYRF
jgi:hypothetical protein